jgi:hypothetical protein
MAILPPTIAGPPPASSTGTPSRPISSRWRLPSHRSTVTVLLRPNQGLILHRPGHHSGRATRRHRPPHWLQIPIELRYYRGCLTRRDFVPWRLSDTCRPRPPTPASPLGRPTNLHNCRQSRRMTHIRSSAELIARVPREDGAVTAPLGCRCYAQPACRCHRRRFPRGRRGPSRGTRRAPWRRA